MVWSLLQWLAAISLLSVANGCASIEPAQRYGGRSVASLRSAYVVVNDDTDRTIAASIQGALAKRNVQASIGPLNGRPAYAEFYVTYTDHWGWDLTMYLTGMDVEFLDNRTGQLIASGAIKNSLFHSYPDVGDTARQVVDSICNAK